MTLRRRALTSFQQEDKPQDPSGYESHDHETQQDQTATCRQRRYVEQHRINHDSLMLRASGDSPKCAEELAARIWFERRSANSRIAIRRRAIAVTRAVATLGKWRRSARGIG